MPSLAVNGIVLRHANYRDNDRMLTLLTPDHGRMDVLARGCRRPRSPLLSASEMFCTGEYLLFTQRDRATLTSCTIHDSFYPLRLDFDRLSYGVYLMNLCEAAAQPEQPCPELFWLLIRFLSRLSYGETRHHALTSAFLLH
ncbi:MAG: DNA repair protein RecO, partial [Clostridia bacterium]|nr:DNA repair protein RecO [Clostridia bacterium]